MTSDERRKDERIAANIDAVWSAQGAQHVSRVVDISLGGCLLETEATLVCGETISLQIFLPDDQCLTTSGDVVSIIPERGLGIRFGLLDHTQLELLAQVIGTKF